MYCSNCGKPVEAGAAKCAHCGVTLAPPAEGVYAGFWRRGAAYIIDSLVLLVPGAAITFTLGDSTGALLAQLAMWWLYKAALESGAWQATVGKKAFGIKVTDREGERISFARASGRFFASLLSTVILGIGLVMAGLTRRKQALHDMLAGCLVVRATAAPGDASVADSTMPVTGGVLAVVILFFILPFFGGIAAAIAIPAYQDYTVRAKVNEAISAAGPTREAPVESPYVRQVVGSRAAKTMEIVLAPEKIGLGEATDARIRFTARGDGEDWTCTAQGVPPKYLPPRCRQ